MGTSQNPDVPPSMSPRALQGGTLAVFETKFLVLQGWQESPGMDRHQLAALTLQLTRAADPDSLARWRWPAAAFTVMDVSGAG